VVSITPRPRFSPGDSELLRVVVEFAFLPFLNRNANSTSSKTRVLAQKLRVLMVKSTDE
jgi:hypothetical protein